MFNKLNLSYFCTTLGYWIALFFIPLLVLETTQSPLLVSISYALDTLPYIFLTPIAGAIADKFNKKYLIVLGEFFCFLTAILLFIIPFDKTSVFLVISLGFFISSLSAVHHPIFQSILPDIYPEKNLPKINGDIATISSFTGIIAPAILGILFGFLKNKQIALFIPSLYFVSFISFLCIKYEHQKPSKKVNILKDNREAILYLKKLPELMSYSYLFFFINFGLRMILSSLIWIYTINFHLENNMTAYHYIFIGIMSIFGAKIAGKYITPRYETNKIIFYSSIIISILILSLIILNNVFYLTLIWGLVSLFSMFIVVSYFTYRQKQAKKELLSRVVALTRLISYLAIAPSALLSGYLLDISKNQNWVYVISGFSILLPTLYFMNKNRQ